MTLAQINVNVSVKVKLTELGKKRYTAYQAQFPEKLRAKLECDEQGYTSFILWELFGILEPGIGEMLFENCDVFIDADKIKFV